MKLLTTGFGPFRNIVDNPSAILSNELPGETLVLPVQYGKVEAFARSVREIEADTILCLGLNAKADDLRFELYAHNQIGGEPGHGARRHTRSIIRVSGPQTLGQTLLSPAELRGLTMATSFTPGDYLCNFLLYLLLIRYPKRRIGFVHVPLFETVPKPDQVAQLSEFIQMLEPS